MARSEELTRNRVGRANSFAGSVIGVSRCDLAAPGASVADRCPVDVGQLPCLKSIQVARVTPPAAVRVGSSAWPDKGEQGPVTGLPEQRSRDVGPDYGLICLAAALQCQTMPLSCRPDLRPQLGRPGTLRFRAREIPRICRGRRDRYRSRRERHSPEDRPAPREGRGQGRLRRGHCCASGVGGHGEEDPVSRWSGAVWRRNRLAGPLFL